MGLPEPNHNFLFSLFPLIQSKFLSLTVYRHRRCDDKKGIQIVLPPAFLCFHFHGVQQVLPQPCLAASAFWLRFDSQRPKTIRRVVSVPRSFPEVCFYICVGGRINKTRGLVNSPKGFTQICFPVMFRSDFDDGLGNTLSVIRKIWMEFYRVHVTPFFIGMERAVSGTSLGRTSIQAEKHRVVRMKCAIRLPTSEVFPESACRRWIGG